MCCQDFRLDPSGNVEVWFLHVVHLGGQQRGHNSQAHDGEVRRGSGETAPRSKTAAVSPLPHIFAAVITHVVIGKFGLGVLLSEIWYPTKGTVRTEYSRRGNAS